jgi:hypothetical protein
MKKIITSSVTSTAKQPLLGRSITHLTEGITETFDSVLKKLIYSYSAGDVVIIEGLVDTGTAGVNFNISAGSVYYNGEVYQVAAASGAFAGTVAVLTLTTTYQSGDPVQFTDGSYNNVHQINTMVISNAVSGSGTKDYSACKKLIANPVFAKLTSVGSGAASTSFTLTGWDASPIDDDGIFNITNGRLTPHLGRYKVSLCVTATPSTTPTGAYELNIYKNGVLYDLVCGDSFLGTNAQRVAQFNNYVLTQTTATDYWTFVITTVSGTYTYSSIQLTVEPLVNTLSKAY